MSDLQVPHPRPVRVLRVDASARRAGSTTRALSDALIDALRRRHGDLTLTSRDLAAGLPFVDERWVAANFTAPEQRDAAQRGALAGSDVLVRELQDAEVLVIGVPIYNFGVPAALKAWIDQVARARGSRSATRRRARSACSAAGRPTWWWPPAVPKSAARSTSPRRTCATSWDFSESPMSRSYRPTGRRGAAPMPLPTPVPALKPSPRKPSRPEQEHYYERRP